MKSYKKKIANKLILGFITLTTLSSLITGIVYIQIFYSSQLKTKTDSLLSYAYQLEAIYDVSTIEDTIELYDSLLNARVWILKRDEAPIISHMNNHSHYMPSCHSSGTNSSNEEHKQCEVKSYDDTFIEPIFEGQEMISTHNRNFYYGTTLSVGIPIKEGNAVVGAILLHTPLDTVYAPIIKAASFLGIGMLISALLIFVLARKYALDFTSSIRQMQHTALELMNGDYTVKTGITREDEIGDLSFALDTLATKLDKASKESEKLEQIRQDFVANVSHEFRTPLTVIKGNVESLIDHATHDVDRAYENIFKETVILETLVTDLLDLSRLQQDKIDIHLEPLYLPEVIQDALRSIRQVAQKKNIEITRNLANVQRPVHSDYLRLRQIFIILLDNAVKYTPEEGTIKVILEVEEQMILKITDTGIGIAEEEIPFIWDRFYKVDKSRDASKSSSGLGLAIAKDLMRLLHIKVEVTSQLNEGTTFTLYIPLE